MVSQGNSLRGQDRGLNLEAKATIVCPQGASKSRLWHQGLQISQLKVTCTTQHPHIDNML